MSFEGKNLVPTVKHASSTIMIWEYFNAAGTGKTVCIEGIMYSERYQVILNKTCLVFGWKVCFRFELDHAKGQWSETSKQIHKRIGSKRENFTSWNGPVLNSNWESVVQLQGSTYRKLSNCVLSRRIVKNSCSLLAET